MVQDEEGTIREQQGEDPVRVLVYAAEQMTLDAVAAALEPAASVEVVSRAMDADDLSRYSRGHRPGVVLLIASPGDPVELTESAMAILAESSPESRVLVLGRSFDAEVVRGVLRAGANGYVLALQGTDELVEAIGLAALDYAYVSHRLGCEIARIPDAGPQELSAREAEVVRLVSHGHTNAEAAEMLSLSVRTVESHRRTILEKLGFTARHELVAYAIERGLLPLTAQDGYAKKNATATMA